MSLWMRLQRRQEWQFFAALPKADWRLAFAWYVLLALRGLLPAVFAVAMGALVGAVGRGDALGAPLTLVGVIFVLLQVVAPIHQAIGANLGDRTAAWLYDRLTEASVRPPGMGHLESPALASDLTAARDFDLGMTGPPLSISMEFIAGGLVELIGGLACALVLAAYAWWAPIVLAGAWLSTHWLLRESGVWRDRNTEEVRRGQRDAEYAWRIAVDPAPARELRLFGLASWTLNRFLDRRTHLHALQDEATRLRERPLAWSLVIVGAANLLVLWSIANAAIAGRLDLGQLVTFAQSAIGTSMIAFGGLNWALDGASAPVAAIARVEGAMATVGALARGDTRAAGLPAREIRFRNVTFAYPGGAPVLDRFDLVIPAGASLAIVGQNGAGKTTLAKLLCRLYDPQSGAIEIDGIDLRELEIDDWRGRVTAVFQDFVRYELPLRENVAPAGARTTWYARRSRPPERRPSPISIRCSRAATRAERISRVANGSGSRSPARLRGTPGAGLVLLDEPTAQLDVRGEAEIFDRVLTATRHCTTILISHRFSTVRHADRICVLEQGRVVELGTHDELMAKGGRYRTMFELQARRFHAAQDEEGATYDVLA